ncbi:MAG: hypothetical protein ACRD43_00165 [Pyrinomonadaceae bacterium]
MGNWIGLGFFVLLVVGIILGLRALAKPRTRTTEEFERGAAEGTTALGASMNALHELMNPEAAKAKEVITQMKEGRYQKKKREGKANDDGETDGRGDARVDSSATDNE